MPQCGYCQSGMLMTAAALLAKKPKPTDADIDGALGTHICRCGTYNRIRKAVHRAAGDVARRREVRSEARHRALRPLPRSRREARACAGAASRASIAAVA